VQHVAVLVAIAAEIGPVVRLEQRDIGVIDGEIFGGWRRRNVRRAPIRDQRFGHWRTDITAVAADRGSRCASAVVATNASSGAASQRDLPCRTDRLDRIATLPTQSSNPD